MTNPAGHPRVVLLTGPPRCGKSTLIDKLIQRIRRPVNGFVTEEIREGWRRVGFSIRTLEGKRGTLAHREIQSPHRVGSYGVNVKDIETIAIPSMMPSRPAELVIIDEIGKMECFSPAFREAVLRVLDSSHDVIASISERGGPFIQKIKARPHITLIRVTEENRDWLVATLAEWFDPDTADNPGVSIQDAE